ncbi:unnamed protein product [Hymenolepis diminuta]|uniref:ATP-dependent RNA helicase n=1 Tax=Hymenolepis diminuta TaxID=6216 RepID=A0A564YH62_HYMDI|nr:unnamed protein product [Hymenolepis diminuta]
MDTNESEIAKKSKSTDRDNVVGGFTIVRDKLRYKRPKVKQVLPYWITNPIKCSNVLEKGVKVKEFDRFDHVLRKNLKHMGIKRLFPIQTAVIPYILDFYEGKSQSYVGQPRDICISAPTGSGKTLSYALPILQLLKTCEMKVIRSVVILPVRDLAKQVAGTFRFLAENISLRVVLLTGEESFTSEQEDIFKKQDDHVLLPDIIVCTPGRLVDHIYNTPNFCLEHVRFLVIDEADRIIAEEKQDWFNIFESAVYGAANLSNSKAKLRRSFPLPTIESQTATTPFTLQKILLSATLTHDPEPLKRFRLNFPRLFLAIGRPEELITNGLLKEGNQFKELFPTSSEENKYASQNQEKEGLSETKESKSEPLDGAGGVGVFSTPSGLKEFFVELVERQRPIFLVHLVRKLGHERILCFTNSREESKRLATLLNYFEGIKAGALNAGMPLQKRTRLLCAFANGEYQLLICTDAVARGIDVKNISCVVSYKAPQSVKTYVHRIGRTARAGKSGEAYTLLNHNQIRHFKSSLKLVGKHARNFPIHSSKLRPYEKDYKAALAELEKEYKAKPKDAFGVTKRVEEENGKRKRPLNEKDSREAKKPNLKAGEEITMSQDE